MVTHLTAHNHMSLRDVRPKEVGIFLKNEDAYLHDLPADCIRYLFKKQIRCGLFFHLKDPKNLTTF